jgi:ATP-binding cassette subfamily F protein 3
MSVLTFHNLGQSFGAIDIFAGLAGSIPRGARIGLVGPNGIGKTTLLRILAGVLPPTEGGVYVAKGTQIGYLQQEAVRAFADHENTVYGEMLTAFAALRAQEDRLRQMEAQMATEDVSEDLLARYGALQEAFELAGGYDYPVRIQQVLTGLGFAPAQHHMPLAHCSGGQKTRALLARLLLEHPALLVLDEPTNHLDVTAVEWLENTLRAWDGALLIVSHDRYFLDKVTNVIWEMSRNGLETYRGNYSAYLRQRDERWARRDYEFKAIKERFLKDLDFVKRNIARASSTRMAQGRLSRLRDMVKAVEQGGAQILHMDWSQVTESVRVSKTKWSVLETERHIRALQNPHPRQFRLKMRLSNARRGGNVILRSKGLQVGYPGVVLFEAPDIELRRRQVVALIGDNGTGKTTFLRTVKGELAPLAGEVRLGANLDVGYFRQAQDALDSSKNVLDAFMARSGMFVAPAREVLARFLFRGDDVFKPVRALSGGERSRLALALLSQVKANLLLLDEPTNHLDIPSQEALQEALQAFEGTILMVTHDRYLVDKLATQIWDLRAGHLEVHKGGYQSYLAAREAALERAREANAWGAENAAARRHPVADKPAANAASNATAQAETEIEETERALQRLGEELALATVAQQWDRVRSLKREYEHTQTALDALLAQWEALAVT